MMYLYFNGEFVKETQPIICGLDQGLMYGEGLFETIRIYDGKPLLFDLHWARLMQGAKLLEITLSANKEIVEEAIQALLEMNKLSCVNAAVRMDLTRGCATNQVSNLCIKTFRLPPFPSAVKLITANTRVNEYSPLAQVKSLNYLDNVLARKQAYHSGADDALLLNTKGTVAETTIANIFIVKNKTSIITPPLTDGPLPGIAREIIIDVCQALGIQLRERTIKPNELYCAKEIFISNALKHAVPVKSLDGQLIGEGTYPVTEQIKLTYDSKLAKLARV